MAESGQASSPWLCRIGLHASRFGDGCRCWIAHRCNRCLRSRPAIDGERVDECRRLVSAGQHPEGGCQGATTVASEGRTLSPDQEQALIEEGYEMALRDMLSEFDRTEKAVGHHAQPDYWFGAKQVVRTLMKDGDRG